jgi:hypothetical protein
MVEQWLAAESQINKKNLLQWRFVHHEPYMKSPGIEAGHQFWKASGQLSELWHGPTREWNYLDVRSNSIIFES